MSIYPLPRELRETTIAGDGRAAYGPFGFRIWDAADVVAEVSRQGAAVTIEPVSVVKTSDTPFADFTAAFATSLSVGDTARILSRRLHSRSVDVIRGGSVWGEGLERELSKQGTVLQEQRRDIDRFLAGLDIERHERVIADQSLGQGIQIEGNARAEADFIERTERIANDVALQNNLQTEGNARAADDAILHRRIDLLSGAQLEADAFFALPTFAALGFTFVPSFTVATRLAGYYAAGDAGAWIWKRVASQPAHAARQRSRDRFLPDGSTSAADGGWWEPVALPYIDPCACGAKADWNILARTGTDNAPMLQAAADVATKQAQQIMGAAAGIMRIPVGNFGQAATVRFPGNFKVYGAGRELTKIWRAADFGDTWIFADGSYANRVEVHDLEMWHSLGYDISTNANMQHKATKGAHIRVYGAQGAIFRNLQMFRLPYGIYSVGGTGVILDNCFFYGVWDVENVANQEGIAQVFVEARDGYSLPTNWTVKDCYFAGQASNQRSLTWSAGGADVTRTYNRSIGSQYGLLFRGIENGKIVNNHFGGLAFAELAFLCTANAPLLDVEIKHNFFDGCSHGVAVRVQPSGPAHFGLDMQIADNTFIDQVHAIEILRNQNGQASLFGLAIHDNTCRNGIGTPIKVGGAVGGKIYDNVVNSYNRMNLSQTDADYVAGILVNDVAADIDVHDNKIGGGVYYESAQASTAAWPTPGNTNFCWYDIIVPTGLSEVYCYDNRSSKALNKRTPNAPAGMR